MPEPLHRLLVVGRHARMMEAAKQLLSAGGYEVVGALTDEEAIDLMGSVSPAALIIGGGVEAASRSNLKGSFTRLCPGRPVVEHFGGSSGLLEHVKQALGKAA